jgi:Cytochrome oxidase complex assembly protein 1
MGSTVYNPPVYSPAPRRKSWFERNWKWFVPAVLVFLVAIAGLFVLAILSFVNGLMRSSDAYKTAIQRAEQSPMVAVKIGHPFRVGRLIAGSINLNNDSGEAELSIPISGDRGTGHILVGAKKSAGKWTFQTLEVHVDGDQDVIPLLGPDGGPPPDDAV